MKDQNEIQAAADRVDVYSPSKYPGTSYEEGVRQALEWVLGDIPDEEFEYGTD